MEWTQQLVLRLVERATGKYLERAPGVSYAGGVLRLQQLQLRTSIMPPSSLLVPLEVSLGSLSATVPSLSLASTLKLHASTLLVRLRLLPQAQFETTSSPTPLEQSIHLLVEQLELDLEQDEELEIPGGFGAGAGGPKPGGWFQGVVDSLLSRVGGTLEDVTIIILLHPTSPGSSLAQDGESEGELKIEIERITYEDLPSPSPSSSSTPSSEQGRKRRIVVSPPKVSLRLPHPQPPIAVASPVATPASPVSSSEGEEDDDAAPSLYLSQSIYDLRAIGSTGASVYVDAGMDAVLEVDEEDLQSRVQDDESTRKILDCSSPIVLALCTSLLASPTISIQLPRVSVLLCLEQVKYLLGVGHSFVAAGEAGGPETESTMTIALDGAGLDAYFACDGQPSALWEPTTFVGALHDVPCHELHFDGLAFRSSSTGDGARQSSIAVEKVKFDLLSPSWIDQSRECTRLRLDLVGLTVNATGTRMQLGLQGLEGRIGDEPCSLKLGPMTTVHVSDESRGSRIMVDLPLVALDLDRTTLVGVQYLLDDLARSRLLDGSRSGDSKRGGAMIVQAVVGRVEVNMYPSGERQAPMSLVLVQLDTMICLGSATAGLRATLSVGSLSLDSISPILFCAPTVQALQLEYRTNSVSSLKTSTLAVQLHGLSVLARPADIQLIEQLAALLAAPEGLLAVEVEREVLSLTIDLAGGTLHVLAAEPGAARVIVELEALRVQTTIRSGSPRLLVTERTHLRLRLGETQLWLTDRAVSVEDGNWESQGMASIARVDGAALALTAQETTTSVELSKIRVDLSLCADTIFGLQALASSWSSSDPTTTTTFVPEVPRDVPPPRDLFASVDPSAFSSSAAAGLFRDGEDHAQEWIDDDVPTNAHYLSAGAPTTPIPTFSGVVDAPQRTRRDKRGEVISDVGGETIRMLVPGGLNIVDGYMVLPRESSDIPSVPPPIFSLAFKDVDVKVKLYEGYDMERTKCEMERSSRKLRRKLEKIRGMLDRGVMGDAVASKGVTGADPEASLEEFGQEEGWEAGETIFGSVHFQLPEDVTSMDADSLGAAISAEEPDEPSSQPTSSSSSKTAHLKFARAARAALEVSLTSLVGSFTLSPLPSFKIQIGSLQIEDFLPSSTWRRFLTELRVSDGGTPRAEGQGFVRLEARQEEGMEGGWEVRLKVGGVRLYVDQDALDFLKKFGTFQGAASSPNPSNQPFFQRVSIEPIRLKLDYKPKRVDYNALLRQGNMLELMNFFHFDGSEMVLRGLVVGGVSGVERLSTLVQHIWTPDVKTNQLSSIIAGVYPFNTLISLSSGLSSLLLLPLEQYRQGREGGVSWGLRGMKVGAGIVRGTTVEGLALGARLARGTQGILEQAESFLNPVPALLPVTPAAATGAISKYSNQPGGVQQGMEGAVKSLGENLRGAAQTILAVPMEVYEGSTSGGSGEGTARAVARAVPIAVLKPMIGASEAVSLALLGLRNSLDPEAQKEAEDKYKSRPGA